MTSAVELWKSQSQTGPAVLLCCSHTSAEPVPSQHAGFQATLILKLSFSSLKGCWCEGKNKMTGSSAPLPHLRRPVELRGSSCHLGVEADGKSASFPLGWEQSTAWPVLMQLRCKRGPGGLS